MFKLSVLGLHFFKLCNRFCLNLRSVESNRASLAKSLSKALYTSVGVFKGAFTSLALCNLYIFSNKNGNLTRMKASTLRGSSPSFCEIVNSKLLNISYTRSEKLTFPDIWLKIKVGFSYKSVPKSKTKHVKRKFNFAFHIKG